MEILSEMSIGMGSKWILAKFSNDFLNVNERVGAYDELEKYLKDDAISGFVILYAYKKETDKENEICH